MPLTPRRRAAVAVVLAVAAAAAVAGALIPGSGAAPEAAGTRAVARSAAPAATPPVRRVYAKAPPVHPRLVGKLPAWVAPGGRITVAGWGLPRRPTALLVGGVRVARAVSGRAGRFELAGRVPRASGAQRVRLAVTVLQDGLRTPVGTVVVRPLELAAVGDVTFGEGIGWRIAHSTPRYPWLAVAPTLRAADITTANLEGAVSDRGSAEPDKLFTFRGPSTSVRAAIRFAGVDLFTLANNHSRDFGPVALLDTIHAVRSAGGITVGAGATLDAARVPAILVRGGLRVAFLGYNDVPPWNFTATADTPGTAPAVAGDIDRDVRAARRRADIVVVWFHWGYELQTVQNGRQQGLADAALAAGATVVLGAHSHTLLPVESPQPGRLVAWSLGNFVFVPHSEVTARTGILHVQLGAGGVLASRVQPARIAVEQPRLLGH